MSRSLLHEINMIFLELFYVSRYLHVLCKKLWRPRGSETPSMALKVSMALKGKIGKKIYCLAFSQVSSQGHKQCTLVTNDYHIVYSYIILNMITFSRLWTKQFWAKHPEYKLNFIDYSLQIIKTHLFTVLTQS